MNSRLPVALAFMLIASTASADPIPLTVPAHVQFCVTSNPIPGNDYETQSVRDSIFNGLSVQIENAALLARALTIGVPFVDDVVRTPSPSATPADSDEAHATYVVTQCAIIPAATAGAFVPATGIVQVPARAVVAILCDTANLDDCRRDAAAAVRTSAGAAGAAGKVTVRTRQALSADGSPSSLVAALADNSVIVLREADPNPGSSPAAPTATPSFPSTLAVVSAETSN